MFRALVNVLKTTDAHRQLQAKFSLQGSIRVKKGHFPSHATGQVVGVWDDVHVDENEVGKQG